MTAVVETEIVLSDQMSPQKQYRCIAGAGNRATEKRRRRPLPIRPVSAISSLLLVVALLLGPLPDVVRIASVSAAASGSGMGSGIAPTVPGVLPVAAGQNELPEKEVLPLEVLAEDGEEWRQELPDELQKRAGTLVRISLSGGGGGEDNRQAKCDIYLLGTSHVSRTSSVDAQLLMEYVRPDVLFIELCHQRLGLLSDETGASEDGGKQQEQELEQLPRQERQPRGMDWSAGMLTKIQADYADKLGVTVGGEFRACYHAARRQQRNFKENVRVQQLAAVTGQSLTLPDSVTAKDDAALPPCMVILGDRPVRLTLLRAWESLRFFGKVKLVLGLLWSSLRPPSEEELREWMDKILEDPNNDLLSESIAELKEQFPTIEETIISERDRYMACKLIQTVNLFGTAASGTENNHRRKIVAVVGAGHCPGIKLMLSEMQGANGGYGVSPNELEVMLQNLVETKKHKADDSLCSTVTELHLPRE